MIWRAAAWLALCLPLFGHELAVDVQMQKPQILLRASYGPGEPAAHVAVAASKTAKAAGEPIQGETDDAGAFAFTPSDEGEWLVRVDDGYGHVATRTVVVNWTAPAAEHTPQSSLWARTGAGLVVIFGLTAFVFWGRRRTTARQP